MKKENDPGTPASGELMRAVHDLARLQKRDVRKICEESGVPLAYRCLLAHLGHRNGCSQKELAECSGLTPASVSVTLEKMERDGYIQRRRDASDGRAVCVFLTGRGEEIDRKIKEKVTDLEKKLASRITPEEEATAAAILHKILGGEAPQCESEKRE